MTSRIEHGSNVVTGQEKIPVQKRGLRDRLQDVRKMPTRLFRRMYYPGMMHRVGMQVFIWEGISTDLTNRRAIENLNRERDNIDLLKPYLETGMKLIIAVSHEGLGDALQTVPVANAITKRFPEHVKVVRYLLSKTIGNGKQGESTSANMEEAGRKQFRRNGMKELEVITNNDRRIRGETSSLNPGVKMALAFRQAGAALMVHMQGNMDAGRQKKGGESGEINGMGYSDPKFREFLERVIQNGVITRKGEPPSDVVILAVSIHGSYKIWDPNHKDSNAVPPQARGITESGRKIIIKSEIASLLGLSYPDLPIGIVKVHKPIPGSTLRTFEDPVREVELIIAEGLPEKARGVHRETVRQRIQSSIS